MSRCQCVEVSCPRHPGETTCDTAATRSIFRADDAAAPGREMCDSCQDDALDSGQFITAEDHQFDLALEADDCEAASRETVEADEDWDDLDEVG